MAKLLYIESSPRKERSSSISIANSFIESYRANHPDDDVETIDLWDIELPEFDGFTIDAKYQILHGQDFTPEQAAAWQKVVVLCSQFVSADKYIFSLPMWNFGIPYKLKHYIDLIAQPGQTFSFDPETGYTGLVTGKPIVVIYARGGTYSEAATEGLDFQKGYMDLLLGFIGLTEVHSILVEPTLGDAESVTNVRRRATQEAVDLAKSF